MSVEDFIKNLPAAGDSQNPPEAEQQEEKKPDEPEAEPAKQEETPTEPQGSEEDLTKTVEDLRKQAEIAEKRRKDSEAGWTRQQQEIAELKRQLEDSKPKTTIRDDEDVAKRLAEFKALATDDPEKAVSGIDDLIIAVAEKQSTVAAERVRDQIQKEMQAEREAELARQERDARAKYEDWDDVVTDAFIARLASDQSLSERWGREGGTAEAVYKIAQKEKEVEAFRSDPDALIQQKVDAIVEQRLAELKKQEEEPSSLAGVRSAGQTKNKEPSPFEDPDLNVGKLALANIHARNVSQMGSR